VTADLDLLKGTLDTLVLKTLSWGPRHGYAVARWIKDATDGTITVDWRSRNHVFTDLAGCHCSAFLLGGQQATPIGGAKATSNFFDGLGVRPILGRPFSPVKMLSVLHTSRSFRTDCGSANSAAIGTAARIAIRFHATSNVRRSSLGAAFRLNGDAPRSV
jgi:hypothetical protein